MSEAAQAVLLVVAGIFVGSLIPLLISARALVKRTEALLATVEPKLSGTLDDLRLLVRRSDAVVDAVSPAAPKVALVVDDLQRIVGSMERGRSSLDLAQAIVTVVVPAVAAAWSAYRSRKTAEAEAAAEGGDWDDPPHAGEPTAATAQSARQVAASGDTSAQPTRQAGSSPPATPAEHVSPGTSRYAKPTATVAST